ncbi:IS110 family transposase [Paraburkholderia sp. CNPSo 3281]|uniref:IS110 family transposase n=1 Tax=Paraburkholderia sp. CNPSo 3281 TaxID=2940933 RepID=UPI0020B7CD9A|nr:IS110 family transposase [Paraburkholderia sp. CNPSo 3281]MCP3721386.1 IS110 family transposase [Paraburkholderia sp. CNPSo 3281]
MKQFSKFVGLDVHKATIAVSVADANGGEVRYVGEIANTPEAIEKLVRQLRKGDAHLSFCYEAGPCGYGIYRQLSDLGWDCQVVAPSLIPRKAGERVKTDRRDSLMLARLHRAGELTAVWVPDDAQEGLRDLTRAREDMKHLQRQAKQRLSAFLLRYGKCYSGKSNWTQAHYRWLEQQKFGQPVQQIVFQEYVDTVKALSKRIDGLDTQLERVANESVFWPVIEGLMALRGVNLLTAMTVVAEIGDLRRFDSAPQLMAYLGLVPSEHSSGATKSRGAITKTGNAHVRRVLVEASWTYRHPARKTAHLQRRAERTSEAVQDIAWKAQKRLCARYRIMEGKGKLKVQACTAVARELTGFIWAIGQALPQPVPNR